MVVLLGRFCGPRELGIYSLGFTVIVLLYSALQSLVGVPYTIYVPRMRDLERRRYAGGVLAHGGLLALLAMSGLTIAAIVNVLGVGTAAAGPVLWMLVVAVPFLLLRELGRRFAFAEMQMARALALDAIVIALQLLLVLWLTASGRLSAVSAIAAMAASCGLVGVAWLYANRGDFVLRRSGVQQAWHQNWPFAKWMLADQTVLVLNSYVPHWLLAVLFGVAATGRFAASAQIFLVLNPLVLGLNNVLTPRVARAMSAGGASELRRVLRKAAVVIGVTVAGFCVFVLVFGERILRLYGHDYSGQEGTLAVLALEMLVTNLGMAPSYGLWVRERSRSIFQIRSVRLFLVVVTTLSLAPRCGPIAAAYGLLVGSAVGTTLIYWAYRRIVADEVLQSARVAPEPTS
jgi:O-antigen/teichoic acid export membrane protein